MDNVESYCIWILILLSIPWSTSATALKDEDETIVHHCHNWYKEWRSYSPATCPVLVSSYPHFAPLIYLLYDINPPEGFNLRRDVYIRLAVFMHHLRERKNRQKFLNPEIRLVLPPWRRLYHWRSHHIDQDHLPWHRFFDIESLKRYTSAILDFPEFIEECQRLYGWRNIPVHRLIRLEHFKDLMENGVFRDRWQWFNETTSEAKDNQKRNHLHLLKGSYLLEEPLLLEDKCIQRVQFQGGARLLEGLLLETSKNLHTANRGPQVIALLNAEVVLHDHWSDHHFWLARRSMRFASRLVEVADGFRREKLNSTNDMDGIHRLPMWEYELSTAKEKALGGPYLAVHIRRSDFVEGRQQTTPTLKSTALQIVHHLNELQLKTVFVATDATIFEVKNLKSYFPPGIRLLRFTVNDMQLKAELGDGGIAIVDQLICAHGRRFVGTYESTFTYRIYEEREILGFPRESTFNTLCKRATMEECERNTVWSIVY